MEGDTTVVQESGFFLTDAQFQDMASAVDSLDYWRERAQDEEFMRKRWRKLYTDLDSLYEERAEISQSSGFSLRDAGFWGLLGTALGVTLDDLLEAR